MRNEKFVLGFCLFATAVILLYFAPDVLALVFVAAMICLVSYGFVKGILKVLQFCESFRKARKCISAANEVQTSTPWNVLKTKEFVFENEALDDEFRAYCAKVQDYTDDPQEVIYPIEEYINEEFIELHVNDALLGDIPGVLTTFGILGTFIGLIVGLGDIMFTSVETAVSTIQVMLSGVRLAFYTSIAGVILSVLFNWCYRRVWYLLKNEMTFFYRDFHKYAIPSLDEQKRIKEALYRSQMLEMMKEVSEKLSVSKEHRAK